ncbi:MAG: MBL fold metallo-hydrolase, partial [Deltaproteobacteria bacterium]|nr:MBL fold metallo-hydrolase [Deltaproteobacteria bacterium]
GLVITHEHADHIQGAGPLARRFDLPVFINNSTLRRGRRILGSIPRPVPVCTGQTVTLHDLFIETFTKCHDAADPMGLVLSCDGTRLGFITDLGRSTAVVEDRLRGCRALIIEFNHDEKMLEEGPYPPELKRRIRGPDGHLSNRQAAGLIKAVAHRGLELLVLAHLSEANNLPQEAFRAVKEMLRSCGNEHTEVLISSQHHPVPMVEL